MIPYMSKLKNVKDLNQFDNLYTFKKHTIISMIPTIYDENKPYYNNVDGSYYMIIYTYSVEGDIKYKGFLSRFLTNEELSLHGNYLLTVFLIKNDKINFVGYTNLSYHNCYTFNVKTGYNIIYDGLNVVGIRMPIVQNPTGIDTEVIIGNNFKIQSYHPLATNNNLTYEDVYGEINLKYRFPCKYDKSLVIDFSTYRIVVKDIESYSNYTFDTRNNCIYNGNFVNYSDNDFITSNNVKYYKTEDFDHEMLNIDDDSYIAYSFKLFDVSDHVELDIYHDGTVTSYSKYNITSIVQISDYKFQIVQDGILYECKLKQDTGLFYDLIYLDDINNYKNGILKSHVNIYKIGGTIISSINKRNVGGGDNYYFTAINGNQYITPTQSPYNQYLFNTYTNYYVDVYSQTDSLIKPFIGPAFYEFDSFIISPRSSLIYPKEIMKDDQVKTITNETTSLFAFTKREDSIVKITNSENLVLTENDAILISESNNSAFYKIKSNISFFTEGNNSSIIKITNNVADIDGAFKNIDIDSTNSIIAKLDIYEYDKNYDTISYEINVNINEITDLIFNKNKFIKFINPNNKYYITQNGYIFDSLDDIRNNFINILDNNFSHDEININDITTTNVNYIDGIVSIQNTVNKKMEACYDNYAKIKMLYNFISVTNQFNTTTITTDNTSSFNIEYFIDNDGTTYNSTDINYKLYNINVNTANIFKIVCTVEPEYISQSDKLKFIRSDYEIVDIVTAENSYNINSTLLDLSNSIINNNINTSVDILNNNITITNSLLDSTVHNASVDFSNIKLENDQIINIDIKLNNFNLPININNDDIFSSIKYKDYIDIHIKDELNNVVIHYDYIGKVSNIYNLLFSNNIEFNTFGNLPKKCKSQMSANYEDGIDNIYYGRNSYNASTNGVLYNVVEQNSSKFFIPHWLTGYYITAPTLDNQTITTANISQTPYHEIDIQPTTKESHTYILDAYVNNELDMYNNFSTGSNLVRYGYNYAALAQGGRFGISIMPPHKYGSSSYAQPVLNTNGYIPENFVDMDYTGGDNLNYKKVNGFVFNKKTNVNYNMERTYCDSTETTGDDIYNGRYFNNAYYINSNIDQMPNMPIVHNAKFSTGIYTEYIKPSTVKYFEYPIPGTTNVNAGFIFSNIIDFDYELSKTEIEYITANMKQILTTMYIEKNKCGRGMSDSYNYLYNYMRSGSYNYDISRSTVNIKLIKKYSTVSIFINNILSSEFETTSDYVDISSIVNYGNIFSGDKDITISKIDKCITKKSGFWC